MALLSILTLSAFSAINTNNFAQASDEPYLSQPSLSGSGQIATAHWDRDSVQNINGIQTINAFFAERLTIGDDDKVVLNGLYIDVRHSAGGGFYSGNYICVSDLEIKRGDSGKILEISVDATLLFTRVGTSTDHKITLDLNFCDKSADFTITDHKNSGDFFEYNTEVVTVCTTNPIVSAYVTKLNGNKNDLTITVSGIFDFVTKDMSEITKTFSINNNAAGTYAVGSYNVYVDTKGNDQIRACYIVS